MRLKHTAVVAIFLLSFNAGFGQEEKPRIAVLDFESIGCDSSLGLAASEILRTELGGLDHRSPKHCSDGLFTPFSFIRNTK